MRGPVWMGACAAVVGAAATLVAAGQAAPDPLLLLDRASAAFARGDYRDAMQAFASASEAGDATQRLRAVQGHLRSALRLAEFDAARRDADALAAGGPLDAETTVLVGDAWWASGLFDEAEARYREALAADPEMARARLGVARAEASEGRLDLALDEVRRGLALAPDDADLHAVHAGILERVRRYAEAARAYEAYAALLPVPDSTAAGTALARARLLRSFGGRQPLATSDRDAARMHTLPFKLVRNKVVVRGRVNGTPVDFVLDTGAERTSISPDLARRADVRVVASTLTSGVGPSAWLRVGLAAVDDLEIGALRIRNVPVAVRQPSAGGAPRWQGESLSPLALGLSVEVDYGRRRVTFARALPEDAAAPIRLPMRFHRLPLVRGRVNDRHAAMFVVDTGGELLSLSAETAGELPVPTGRRVRLRVFGLSGLDEDAFVMPGVDIDFGAVGYRKMGLAVLNLRAPSMLLGFRLGGIVGYRLLGGYRVAIDVDRSEVRLSPRG
mgnify:CR=1 FL=1